MTVYYCNPGVAHWGGPYAGSFRPRGRIERVGERQNPRLWGSGREGELAGRLFVGFNVGEDPVWSVDDLIPIVRRVRERQTGDPSASFVMQKGIYRHRSTTDIVEEDGAQVILFADSPDDAFREQLVELGEEIARRLDRESVLVEIQRNGVTQRVLGVAP
jgi:hypothetical protein